MMSSSNPSESTPKATPAPSTDGAVGVPENKWFVGWVASRAEKKVRDNLLKDSIEAYAAVRKEMHIWRRNERREVDCVLIPCVVFVKTELSQLEHLKKYYNINSFMRDPAMNKESGRVPFAVVADAEMRVLKAMLGQDEFDVDFVTSNFKVGEYVKVLGFDSGDQLAQIIRLPNDKNRYVGIRVDFLGCAYMKVPAGRIVKIS